MKKNLISLILAVGALFILNCSGGMTPPDPKRVGCEQSCGVVAEKAVKTCKDQKKSDLICQEAGKAAELKCVDECMAK